MKLGLFRRMKLVNAIVCFVFCFNIGVSGNALAWERVKGMPEEAYMLRPRVASQQIEDTILEIGIEELNKLNAQGSRELEKKLADIALSKIIDPLVGSFIENNIAVVTKDNKTFIVCLIGNGWYVELVKEGEPKKISFSSEKEKVDFMTDAQRTWISMMGDVTPKQIYEAQVRADNYIRQAGEEGRIFVEKGLEQQVAEYAKENGLTPEEQAELLERLQATIDFRKSTIDSLTQSEVDDFFKMEGKLPFSKSVSYIKADLSDDAVIRKTLIYDGADRITFDLMGDPLSLKYLAVTASSGTGFLFEGYKGDYARSLFEILGMTESYMEMADAGDIDAVAAYKAKILLHEYAMVNTSPKVFRLENDEVRELITRYDHMAITKWLERQADKANARILEEENNKTIAEATSANIGKFLKEGIIPSELIDVAEAELQKLVASGLLTDYRIVIKDGKVNILTTRQNSKAIEDDAEIPLAILNVYLSVLNTAKVRGYVIKDEVIYVGEDLTGKTYRQQTEALEISVPLPTLTYLEPEGWTKSFFGKKIRTELTVPEGQKPEFYTNVNHIYKIDRVLAKPIEQIPDAVVDAVAEKLEQYASEGKILSALVNDSAGTDIDIHITHNYGELNAAVHRLALEAMREGLLKAQELGLLKKEIDTASISLEDLGEELAVMANEDSKNERPSEAVVRSKIIGGGIGAANIILYHQYFMPGATPLQQLNTGVPGFRAVVRRTEDILKRNFDAEPLVFESSVDRTVKGKFYPGKNQADDLLALVRGPNDYQITEVWPVEGAKIPVNEAMATVIYQPVYGEYGELRALNPTIINRSQSGADAVAAVADMLYDVNFVPGGPNSERAVVTKAATREEARKAPPEGIAYAVVDGWQSEGNGIIPPEAIKDHVALNPPAVQVERNLADELAEVMKTHPYDQPYMAPWTAEANVKSIRKEQSDLFRRAPKETEVDEMMAAVEAKVKSGEYLSITDDKSDMGGPFGHNLVAEWMLAVYLATVMEAQQRGTLTDGNIIGFVQQARVRMGSMAVGDDGHIIMLGDMTPNSAEGHQLSFLAFTRGYLAAVAGQDRMVNGKMVAVLKKLYGLGQDFAGKEAKAAMANPYFYSRFNEDGLFFKILREVMPLEYMSIVDNMEKGWKGWLEHKEEVTLPPPFSGNVSQQGMGSARYIADIAGSERSFGILAGDKMGPAGLNRPIREAVYAALEAGEFENGAVFEIWDAKAYGEEEGDIPIDEIPEAYSFIEEYITSLKEPSEQDFVKSCYESQGLLKENLTQDSLERLAVLLDKAGFVPTRRIYLDAQADKEQIFLYLADSDRFNVKQVWGKVKPGWDINNPQEYLGKPILGSSVTKLGILAGGAYIGKDDPVMVGNMKLMQHVFEFLKDNPVLLQGDMNGSHWLAAIPTAGKYATATKDSHPILVGKIYTLSEDGKKLADVKDVFDSKDYDSIRDKMFDFNRKFKQACLGGQFWPYGTDVRTVEAAYGLAEKIRRVTAPGSPNRWHNLPEEVRESMSRSIAVTGEIVDLFNVATGALDMPSAPEAWTGADESAVRFYQSTLALQSKGSVSTQLDDDVFEAAKSADSKVILISLSELRKDSSLITALASINEQINQRLGVFGSTENIKANAYKCIGIADDPALRTAEDGERLFAGIVDFTKNGAPANKDMFASIVTQSDMYEGSILNAADLLKQLERMGISRESIAGLVGSRQWTSAIKTQEGVSVATVEGNTDAEEGKIALAGNALFGVVEVVAKSDRQLTESLAKNLELLQQTTTSIAVVSKEINPKIKDEITAYREAIIRI
jgi:fructose 1,6-bisphosphatase